MCQEGGRGHDFKANPSGLGGSFVPHPGLAKSHTPALIEDKSREIKVCNDGFLASCRELKPQKSHPPFPSSSLKTKEGGEEKSLES